MRVTLDEAARGREKRKEALKYYATPEIDKLAVNSGNIDKELNDIARNDGQLVILGQGLVPS